MAPSSDERVSLRTWIAVLGTVLGAFMAVLDIYITNASLREITGGIGSTSVDPEPLNMPLLWEGDWLGTVFMAIGLGSLIAFLEEGQNDDWFTSVFIQRCFTLAVIFIPLFIICEFVSKSPIVNLRLLGIRKFVMAYSECFLAIGVILITGSVMIWLCAKAKAGGAAAAH